MDFLYIFLLFNYDSMASPMRLGFLKVFFFRCCYFLFRLFSFLHAFGIFFDIFFLFSLTLLLNIHAMNDEGTKYILFGFILKV